MPAPTSPKKPARKCSALLLSVAVPALGLLPVLTPPTPDPHPVKPGVAAVALAGVDEGALASEAGRRSGQVAAEAPEPDVEAAEELAADAAAGAVATPSPGARGTAVAAGWATDRVAARREAGRPEVLTAEQGTDRFSMLGVSWRAPAPGGEPTELTVLVRTRGVAGWSDWTVLEEGEPGEPEGGRELRSSTEPYFAGDSTGVQARVDVRRGVLPADLRIDLIDPGASRADAAVDRLPMATAAAAATRPSIRTRADWGADESARDGAPSYDDTIKAGFVHHTAGVNGYSEVDVPRILRGLYAHALSTGYSDLQYNFLVDRFGRLWEGRYGGMDRPVRGGHTGGFNADTFAVAALGNFETAGPPAGMLDSVSRLMAWKLSLHGRDATGKTTLTSSGGAGTTSRYPAGTAVTVNVIAPHREVGITACPGGLIAAVMSTIRSKAKGYATTTPPPPPSTPVAAALLSPTQAVAAAAYPSTKVSVRAGVATTQSWKLEVREGCRDAVVRTLTGTATRTSGITATWDGRDTSGAPARPGHYTLTLSSWTSTSKAKPYSTAVDVSAPAPTARPAATPLLGQGSFVPLGDPARLLDTRTGPVVALGPAGRADVPVLGRGGVPATGVTGVALNVTVACPTATSWVTVAPAGSTKASGAVNAPAGKIRAGLVFSGVGAGGAVSVSNSAGVANVVVDVLGYYTSGSGSRYNPVAPTRLYDSRKTGGTFAAGEARSFAVPTRNGTAASAMTGAVLNVTVTGAAGEGVVLVHREGAAPRTSTLNYRKGDVLSNRVVTALSGGRFTVTNRGAATHVVVDLVGFYAPPAAAAAGGRFTPVTPSRLPDTRTGTAVGAAATKSFGIAGKGGVPADAKAVVMTLSATSASAATSVTAYPTGTPRPGTWDLNTVPGDVRANLVVVPVDPGTKAATLYNAAGSTHLVADVVGYYR